MKPKISVIIPCLNEERRLGATLQALREQPASPDDFEIIVVDGGSTDRTAEIAQAAGARVIHSEKGLGRQRNAGARAAAGDWIAFVDADITVSRDWLAQALQRIACADADVLLGPVLAPHDGTWIERAWGVHLQMRRQRAAHAGESVFRLVSTQNLFVERSAFETVGGFDEELSSGEDTFLSYSLRKQGYRIAYDDGLAVCHRGEPKSLRDFFTQQVWHCNREVWERIAKDNPRDAGGGFWYGAVHAAGLAAVACSLVTGIVLKRPLLPAGTTLLYSFLPLALAARTTWIARSPRETPSLAVLYWVYGVARASYLLGLAQLTHKQKRF
ncbi:MAG: glycosyltransferase [Armatimonadota bacterium]|nr:glycosyltransferase [Armatimonadota bacterium]